MALNGLFCADVLQPLHLVPLTDFTYRYGIVEFNVPLDTVWVISETGTLPINTTLVLVLLPASSVVLSEHGE